MALGSSSFERASFDNASPVLTSEAALAKYTAFHGGEVVTSEMIRIGALQPTTADLVVLQGRRIEQRNYQDQLQTPAPQLTELHTAFMGLVQTDMRRGNLCGALGMRVYAGNFQELIHGEVWHSDNFKWPSVRWTVAFGVGSTRSAIGAITSRDFSEVGDFDPNIPVGGAGRLQEQTFPQGDVLRFMNTADVHAGPQGNGGRVMMQATLTLTY